LSPGDVHAERPKLEQAMRKRWLVLLSVLVIGGLLGAGGILVSLEVNRTTSTDAFCTSCHSMKFVAADPYFQRSAHQTTRTGVRPSCGDCHIPKTNWFVETYAHVTSGIRDSYAEYTHDFRDPKAWQAHRVALAHEVRATMRRQDSVTCRGCHDAAAINPASERGRAAHALLREGRMTCIDCHFNLVHAPVPPSLEFIRGSGLGGTPK
jgi:nitrate/TMAO reductase-like tetraheme cytochrome c subunit